MVHADDVVLAVELLEERTCAVGALRGEEGAAVDRGGRCAGGVAESVSLNRMSDRLVLHALWEAVVGVGEDGVGLERLREVD